LVQSPANEAVETERTTAKLESHLRVMENLSKERESRNPDQEFSFRSIER
jgi:hypothetical protein